LVYMNASLNIFAKHDKVMTVSGYMYNTPQLRNQNIQIFLPLISTWGWGTWDRAWQKFDPDAAGYEILKTDKRLRRKFDCNGSYPFSRMLGLQMNRKIDSWGIRWYWSIFKNNGLSCFPPNTLVLNNGFDATATHGSGFLTKFNRSKFPRDVDYQVHIFDQGPINVDSNLYRIFCTSMYHLNGGHIGKIRDILKKYIWDAMKSKK
jgi:hypothetical protein